MIMSGVLKDTGPPQNNSVLVHGTMDPRIKCEFNILPYGYCLEAKVLHIYMHTDAHTVHAITTTFVTYLLCSVTRQKHTYYALALSYHSSRLYIRLTTSHKIYDALAL